MIFVCNNYFVRVRVKSNWIESRIGTFIHCCWTKTYTCPTYCTHDCSTVKRVSTILIRNNYFIGVGIKSSCYEIGRGTFKNYCWTKTYRVIRGIYSSYDCSTVIRVSIIGIRNNNFIRVGIKGSWHLIARSTFKNLCWTKTYRVIWWINSANNCSAITTVTSILIRNNDFVRVRVKSSC